MANICTTEYIFEGDGKNINALRQGLEKQASSKEECQEYQDWHCQPNWLGYLAENELGINPNEISCRGEFCVGETSNSPYEEEEQILKVTAYTAWSPCNSVFEKLAEKYDLKLYWIAEELGCELFQSNDSLGRYFHDTYIVDIDDYGTEYFESEKDAVKYVVDKTGNPDITWSELEDIDGIFTYEVEYV